MKKRKLAYKVDIIIVFLVMCILILLASPVLLGKPGGYAQLYINNTLATTIDLSKNAEFFLPELPDVDISVKNGNIAVLRSDCPDKVCEKFGYIHKNGQTIVCLPNKLVIKVLETAQRGALNKTDVFTH